MKKLLSVAAAWSIVALSAQAESGANLSPMVAEPSPERPAAKAAPSDEEAAETAEAAASSEGEATMDKTEAEAETTAEKANPAQAVDMFNLPRRIRSQISYTTKRMLEFDKNSDGLLSQDELPKRMQGVIAKGDLNADALLDKEELTRMAYNQIQKRDAKAEAEPHEKR